MKLFLVFVIITIPIIIQGQIVSKQTAEVVARNFYREKEKKFSNKSTSDVEFQDEKESLNATKPNYYVFNMINNRGFIIVSSSYNTKPVLAYSLNGNFDQNSLPPSVKEWMDEIDGQINSDSKLKSSVSDQIKTEWGKYTNSDFDNYLNTIDIHSLKSGSVTSVPPLLSTTWNQGAYYNTLCPVCSSGGSGGHVWTGCVATAQAQIMKYYNYPNQGVGQKSYTHSVYGVQSANFGATTYDWTSMPSNLSSQNNALATLMYHCGVSVNMNYSPSGSGASESAPRTALINYFKYSDNALYTNKYSYTDENWIRILKEEINNGRPIFYTGYGADGHAFVCDGYQDSEYFHFNWGWGGAYDGYFYVSSLKPGGNNFTNSQSVIVGILPSNLEQKWDSVNALQLNCGVVYSGSTSDEKNLSNRYSTCTWNETGKEKLHKITTTITGRISAKISNLNGNDLDVFILEYANKNSCLAMGDSIATLDNAPPGTYYVVIDGKNGSEGNYSLSVICPDNKSELIVEKGKVQPTYVIPGGKMNISSTVKNIGNVSSGSNLLYYYLSNNQSLSIDDIYLGSSPVSTLSPQSKIDISAMITLPLATGDGTKYIILKIDATNVVDETDEDINTLSLPVQVPKSGQLDCSNAIVLNNNVAYNGNTQTLGTSKINNYSCYYGLSNKEVVHQFTPVYSGLAQIDFSTGLEGNMVVLLLAGCNENTCISVISNSRNGEGGEINGNNTFYVTGGITYYLVTDANSDYGNSEGPYSLEVKFPDQCPKPFINTANTNKCIGDPNFFLFTNWQYNNFLWKKNDVPINGAISSSISVSELGTYTVEVSENNCIGISDPVVINYSSKPNNNVSVEGSTSLCKGETVTLRGIQTTIMEWYKLGTGKISSSNPLIISQPGSYFLSLENINGCKSISDTFEFKMKEKPVVNLGKDTSIFTNESLILDAGQASGYLWSTGETTQSLTISGNSGEGSHVYSVEVTGENGCKNADTINVKILSVLGIETNIQNLKTVIFPNPSTEYLYIEFDEAIKGTILLELMNSAGKKVLRKNCYIQLPGQREKLEFNGLDKGIYYLKVTMGSQFAFYKIIVN